MVFSNMELLQMKAESPLSHANIKTRSLAKILLIALRLDGNTRRKLNSFKDFPKKDFMSAIRGFYNHHEKVSFEH